MAGCISLLTVSVFLCLLVISDNCVHMGIYVVLIESYQFSLVIVQSGQFFPCFSVVQSNANFLTLRISLNCAEYGALSSPSP